jgi:hypothetical protein
VEQTFFLGLAERVGETRGRAGYAFGALLHLMDAILSYHGNVFSNRKWYLLRWCRLIDSGVLDGTPSARPAAQIEQLRHQVPAVLAGKTGAPLTPAFTELLASVFEVAGEGHGPAVRIETAGLVPGGHFLPGADLLLAKAAVFAALPALPEGPVDLLPGAQVPDDPAGVLRAARGGALRLLPA